MKNLMYFSLTCFILFSCGNSGEEKEKEKEAKKTSSEPKDSVEMVVADTLFLHPDYKNPYPSGITSKEKKMFKEMLGDSLTAELFALYKGFDSISTERQMLIYYRELTEFQDRASSHLSDLNASEEFFNIAMGELAKGKGESEDEYFDEYRVALDYILQNLEPANKYLHGLVLTCVAECTEPNFDLQLDALKAKAKESKGEQDENFIDLIISTYAGDYEPGTMNANYFEPTWDLGGMSLLGSGNHSKFLQATDELLKEKNIFSEWILFYREDCMYDASHWRSFAHSKEKVLAELKSILKKVTLTEEESDAIRSQIKDIENGNPDKDFRFDCKTNDCQFG